MVSEMIDLALLNLIPILLSAAQLGFMFYIWRNSQKWEVLQEKKALRNRDINLLYKCHFELLNNLLNRPLDAQLQITDFPNLLIFFGDNNAKLKIFLESLNKYQTKRSALGKAIANRAVDIVFEKSIADDVYRSLFFNKPKKILEREVSVLQTKLISDAKLMQEKRKEIIRTVHNLYW